MDEAREWLETDGLGGYAMGTANRVRTRRYHGLLVTATQPPGGRMVLVNDVEVWAETEAGRVALTSHRYRNDVTHPDGAERIRAFDWRPWPCWHYDVDGRHVITCELLMPRGQSRVLLRWRHVSGTGSIKLWVRPLVSGRDHHMLHHENPGFDFAAGVDGDRVCWRPYPGVPAVTARSSGTYHHDPDWYRHFVYRVERERGLDFEEDLASPGVFELDLADPAVLAFEAGEPRDDTPAAALWAHTAESEQARRAAFASPLHRAADAYLVTRGEGLSVIAGYPWFTDWGRDSFIALRGLCLAADRAGDALAMVTAWAGSISEGMVPNRFLESGSAAEYNSVDASLWYVIAVDEVLRAQPACPRPLRERLHQAILAIVSGYHDGTRHNIGADADGLLRCGAPGLQLTWMDARVGDWVVTPRIGKPVEIQALWINALAIAARVAPRWTEVFERARASFVARFWNTERNMLNDVVDCDHVAGTVDPSFRPNQVFAIGGLPLPVLDGACAKAVVDAVEDALWTPAGLRSLAPGEPGYVAHYRGGVRERDGSYHQGIVWTWLAGPFIEAWLRVHADNPDAAMIARRRFLAPLLARLDGGGVGHLAEIADAEPPFAPRGAPFQAWSVAETLRIATLLDAAA